MSTEDCSICLKDFERSKTRLIPCEHEFHKVCIKQWAEKASNTCPLCRTKFSIILTQTTKPNGEIIEKYDCVEDRELADPIDNGEAPNYTCRICQTDVPGDGPVTLICDGCESGYHMFCLNPPVYVIPVHEFYCPTCVEQDNIQIRVDSIMQHAPETVHFSGCTLCTNSFAHDIVIGCLTCKRQFHPTCYNSNRNFEEPRYSNNFCSKCRFIAPASEFQLIRLNHNRKRGRATENTRNCPIETIVSRFRQQDDFVLGSDMQCDFIPEGTVPTQSMPSFFSRRSRKVRSNPRGRRRTRKVKRKTRRSRRKNKKVKAGNEIRERISPERHQSPQYRLGITYNPGLEYFEDESSTGEDDLPQTSNTSTVCENSKREASDLLSRILNEQLKTHAPGNLFKQENGKFVPRNEFEKYKNGITSKPPDSNKKAWHRLKNPVIEREGRSDGKPSIAPSYSKCKNITSNSCFPESTKTRIGEKRKSSEISSSAIPLRTPKTEPNDQEILKDISEQLEPKDFKSTTVKEEPFDISMEGPSSSQDVTTSFMKPGRGRSDEKIDIDRNIEIFNSHEPEVPQSTFPVTCKPVKSEESSTPRSSCVSNSAVGFSNRTVSSQQLLEENNEKKPIVEQTTDKRSNEKLKVKHIESLIHPIMIRAFRDGFITNDEYKGIMRVFVKEAFKRKWSDTKISGKANDIIKNPKNYKKIIGLKDASLRIS